MTNWAESDRVVWDSTNAPVDWLAMGLRRLKNYVNIV